MTDEALLCVMLAWSRQGLAFRSAALCLQSLSLSGAGSPRGGSSGSSSRRLQPLYEVAYNPEEIKARLSGVPVYAVINKREEFVLVAGGAVRIMPSNTCKQCLMIVMIDLRSQATRCHCTSYSPVTARNNRPCHRQEDSQNRNIGLFFFNRRDAESLIEKVYACVVNSILQWWPVKPEAAAAARVGTGLLYLLFALPSQPI